MNCECKNKCACNSSNSGSVEAQVSQLQEAVDAIQVAMAPFQFGHPILMLRNAANIALFDSGGKGTGIWTDWAFCNGNTFVNSKGETYITTNLIDKFVVGAGGTYPVDATGGAATVSLVSDQNGQHTHGVTDAGHDHTIVDPGHAHGVVDPTHTHLFTAAPHGHTLSIDGVGDHNHSIPSEGITGSDGTDHLGLLDGSLSGSGFAGAHTHTGTADVTTVTGSNGNAPTGVSIQNAFTGITETEDNVTGIIINDSGLGVPHENLPPYYAIVFIEKI